jgi:hypothetical protein
VARGLLHVRKENTRRWRYFLTADGLAEKTRLTREFIEFSFEFYREARRRSATVCRGLSEAGLRRIALLGLGELAEITYLGVQEWGLELVEVYDDAGAGRRFFGCGVRPVRDVAGARADSIVVTAFDPKHPMTPDFLPEAVQADDRMVWIFAGADGVQPPDRAEAGNETTERPTDEPEQTADGSTT